MENPIKMDDLGVPLFSETSLKRKETFLRHGGVQHYSCWSDKWKFMESTLDIHVHLTSFTPPKFNIWRWKMILSIKGIWISFFQGDPKNPDDLLDLYGGWNPTHVILGDILFHKPRNKGSGSILNFNLQL